MKTCPICGCEVARGGWTFMKGDLPHLNHDEMMACEDLRNEFIKEEAKPEYAHREQMSIEKQKFWWRVLNFIGGIVNKKRGM